MKAASFDAGSNETNRLKDQAVRVWEQLDENKNGKVSYGEFSRALRRN